MLIIALKTLHNICKPQLYLNSKNLAKISPIAKVVMCMKYQINFTISYDLCCPYKWNQLEKNMFNYHIAFSVNVVPRSSIKLNTCCAACIQSNDHFLLKHSSCLMWSTVFNFCTPLQHAVILCSAS